MPAGGAELPTLLSYYTEKKLSKHPEEFGHGAIEGVAGPEAANNAAAAGVLMPLLTLGIPTSATAAIMLSAFEGYGIQTGPQLFSQQGGSGLDTDRQPLHWQCDFAGAQPAAGEPVGQAAQDTATLAVCGHHRHLNGGRLPAQATRFSTWACCLSLACWAM